MKMRPTLLALPLLFSNVFAATDIGGIKLHSQIPAAQVKALKTDLAYLYKTPVKKADKEFLSISNMLVGDGPHMHNWVLNRVRYVIDEKYDFEDENNFYGVENYKFPSTPLPDAFSSVLTDGEKKNEVKTIMSNMGAAFYLLGKKENIMIGIKFDDEVAFAPSPRAGILQIGEGLFDADFLLNKNPLASANSVSRLGTLFHEARHSDGNSKHTGFIHVNCPAGHAYANAAACEISGNGSYTVGALSLRHLAQNCASCSAVEKRILNAIIADSFSRIIDEVTHKRSTLEQQILLLSNAKVAMTVLAVASSDEAEKKKITEEISAIDRAITILKAELEVVKTQTADAEPRMLDATPEGDYKVLTVKESMDLMKKAQ
jgi:hypothetical protein